MPDLTGLNSRNARVSEERRPLHPWEHKVDTTPSGPAMGPGLDWGERVSDQELALLDSAYTAAPLLDPADQELLDALYPPAPPNTSTRWWPDVVGFGMTRWWSDAADWSRSMAQTEKEEEPLEEDNLQEYITSNFLALYGPNGAGKTSALVALGGQRLAKYLALGTGQRVGANFWIRALDDMPAPWGFHQYGCGMNAGQERHRHTDECVVWEEVRYWHPFLWELYTQRIIEPEKVLFLIDEIADIWGVHGAMSARQRDSTSVRRQMRHDQNEMIGATQFPDDVAGAMQRQVTLWGLVEPIPKEPGAPASARISLYRYKPGERLPMKSTWKKPLKRLRVSLAWAHGNGTDEGPNPRQFKTRGKESLIVPTWNVLVPKRKMVVATSSVYE